MLFNAILCVWNEGDIIESTVKHLFQQGCHNVFLIDNGSSDDTVQIAKKAGAFLGDSFISKCFDEGAKIAHLNTFVKNYNAKSSEESIWWLYVDADEFPHIAWEGTIFDFIKHLNPAIQAVQGYMFHHKPTHKPYFITGYHPIDFMPVCKKSTTSKIPLIRYDKGQPHFYSGGGAHRFDTCNKRIAFIQDILEIHHFPYRRPEMTLTRLSKLSEKNPDGSSRLDYMDTRAKILARHSLPFSDYRQRYNTAKDLYTKDDSQILFIDSLQYNFNYIKRWYDIGEIDLLPRAIDYFFMGEYDLALCRFNDILNIIQDYDMHFLLIIKMAQCLASTDRASALQLLKTALKCQKKEIRDYAIQQITNLDAFINKKRIKADASQFKVMTFFGKTLVKLFVNDL